MWYILTILAFITLGFESFFGIMNILSFAFEVIVLALVSVFLAKIFHQKSYTIDRSKILQSIRNISAFFGFFISLLLAFVAYYNLSPGYISDITLTNGSKVVHFLSMSHIATPTFYTKKAETLTNLARSGSLFIVEGVRPGNKESQKIFDSALGVEFSNDLYKEMADLAELELQSGAILFQGIDPKQMKNVDMSLDDIAIALSGTIDSGATITSYSELAESARMLTSSERVFAKYLFRAVLNWSIIHMYTFENGMEGDKKELFDVILNKRNTRIVDAILDAKETSIAVTYGALHFDGVLSELKKHDSKWSISSFRSYAPYSD